MPAALEADLHEWLHRITAAEQPAPEVVAYNIGLFENEQGFSAYLVGCTRFDPTEDDWATQEDFTPEERYFEISRANYGLESWQEAQAAVAASVSSALALPMFKESFLGKASAVTVGFDDGDLQRIA